MADQAVELDSLLPQASSPTTSDHGEQTAATRVQPPTADQDVGIDDLPPLPPSGPSSSYDRGQSLSNPPSIRASSASAPADFAATPQPPANVPLVELVGTKLQSMIGLLQETVNALSQAAATGLEAEADTASLQEVIVDETESSQGFLLERVKVMSEEEIVAYDKRWSYGWTIDREGKEAGADSWKIIWPEKLLSDDCPNALRLHPCAKDERRTLQLQLLAALCCTAFFGKLPSRTIFLLTLYGFGPLISAIGINLQFYCRDAGTVTALSVPAQRLVRLLVQILRLVTVEARGPLRVGDVLRSCYRRGLLPQPADFESYRDHVLLISHAAHLANTYYRPGFSLAFRNLQRFLKGYSTTDRLLQIPIVELMQATRSPSEDSLVTLPRAEGASFLVNDLNLGTLKVIGGLSVKWTMCSDEHLLLDVQQQELLIAWFPADPVRCPPGSLPTLFGSHWDLVSLEAQLEKTYEVLFGSRSYGKRSKSLNRDYESLPAPPWMTLFGRSALGMWDKKWDLSSIDEGWNDYMHTYLKYQGSDPHIIHFCEDMRNHLRGKLRYRGQTRGQLYSHTYSSYPDYEDRLRVLRAYMDSKKPNGFRGLWRDKRDTYSYYTFWGVIIFGGISVLLGLLSLFVSVLQTIASWKALRPPSRGSHP